MFQRTIINSLLYERRKKIDKIACSNNIQLEDFDKLTAIINSIELDDPNLDRKLEQTEHNIKAILNGTYTGFTNDDVKSVKKIYERFKFRKEQFSDFKKERLEREIRLKNEFSRDYNPNLAREIIRHLNDDDNDFISRYKAYVNFHYDIVEPLAEITLRKWENQLTNPAKYQQGCPFKFLVHAIGTGTETALQNAKSQPIISTSLITDEFQGTFRDLEYGFVYQPNLKNVLIISSSDCYVIDSSFDQDNYAKFFSVTNIPLSPNSYLQYSAIKACKTMHIEEIETDSKKMQKYGIEDGKGIYAYNEIVLLNDPSTNPIAVFLLERENESSEFRANELATRLNLPLLRI